MKSPSQEFSGTMSKMYVEGNLCCWLLFVRACGSQQTGPSGQLENGNVAARLPPFNPAPSHSSYTVVTIVFRSAKVSSPRQLPHPQTVLGGWVWGSVVGSQWTYIFAKGAKTSHDSLSSSCPGFFFCLSLFPDLLRAR